MFEKREPAVSMEDAAGSIARPLYGGAAFRDASAVQHGPLIGGGRADRPHGAGRGAAARGRRALVVAAAAVLLGALAMACWRYAPAVYEWLSNPGAVHEFVSAHALLSRALLLGVNVLQVFVAFLPGEPIELASGYAFGFWEGTGLCLLAAAIGSSMVYWAVRRWGWGVVGVFFGRERFERLGWLKNARRLEFAMLLVFLIPGTPKDVLTYFAGLTNMRFPAVLFITTIGRIPSIITSTIAASAFGAGEYGVVVIATVVAVALAGVGAVVYKRLEGREG